MSSKVCNMLQLQDLTLKKVQHLRVFGIFSFLYHKKLKNVYALNVFILVFIYTQFFPQLSTTALRRHWTFGMTRHLHTFRSNFAGSSTWMNLQFHSPKPDVICFAWSPSKGKHISQHYLPRYICENKYYKRLKIYIKIIFPPSQAEDHFLFSICTSIFLSIPFFRLSACLSEITVYGGESGEKKAKAILSLLKLFQNYIHASCLIYQDLACSKFLTLIYKCLKHGF